MKTFNPIKLLSVLAGLLLVMPQLSYAVGTVAGTNITNEADLVYTVGGGSNITVTSNQTDFEVDQEVNFTVTEIGSDVHVGALNTRLEANVARFTVSHNGNADQRFALVATNNTAGETVTFGATTYTDSNISTPTEINMNTFEIYIDVDDDGAFEPGADDGAPVSFVEINQGVATQTRTIWVWATYPSNAADGEYSVINLTATAQVISTGAALTQDTDGDDPNAVEIVFNDAAGSDDNARDAQHSARDVFQAQAPALTINKTVTTIWDPANAGIGVGTNDPLAIPGAYMRYRILVTNADSAGAAATLTSITDVLSANTTFDGEFIVDDCSDTGVATGCATESTLVGRGISITTGTDSCTGGNGANARAAGTSYFTTTDGDADGAGYTVGTTTVAVNFATVFPNDGGPHFNDGDLLPCETIAVEFNVIVD